MRWDRRGSKALIVALALAVRILLPGAARPAADARRVGSPSRLSFLGEASWEAGRFYEGTAVGGLSGIAWDARTGRFLALSDDPGLRGPARIYVLEIDLEDGSLDSSDVSIDGMTVLEQAPGRVFPEYGIDGEGIALHPAGRLWLSSEGNLRRGVQPFVAEFERDGAMRRTLELPRRFSPAADGSTGPRHNLVYESLTLTPGGRHLFTATENALVQDGPSADLERRSPIRIVRFDLEAEEGTSGEPPDEFLYWSDPVRRPPEPEDAFRVNGLVELVALDEERLLALERSYSSGVGNDVRLYLVSLEDASEIGDLQALDGQPPEWVIPAVKELLIDFDDLELSLDNLEGMTLGPQLADGRSSLVIVGDDNFNVGLQRTQLLAFALDEEPVGIAAIQGRAHRSPLEGEWLRRVRGVITALDRRDEGLSFWLQDPLGDGDPGTSEGLRVEVSAKVAMTAASLEVGDVVAVGGRIVESGSRHELPVTGLTATLVSNEGVSELPAPVILGRTGRMPPTVVVDDDGLEHHDPEFDGADFYESLEGMRVEIARPRVVGPTRRWGELVLLPETGVTVSPETAAGGLRLTPGDANPERLVVSSQLIGSMPTAAVGDRPSGPVVGVLHYDRGGYLLLATEPLPRIVGDGAPREVTGLSRRKWALTVATFNVQNLDALDPEEKFEGLAEIVVRHLRSPDLLALQEVQDDTGPEDDGVVSAGLTLDRLRRAIVATGGPDYGTLQIDPADGADGGQPGGNIRVALLYDRGRLSAVVRGRGGADVAARVRSEEGEALFEPSPGRIAPRSAPFAGDRRLGFEGGRKSLAAEFRFRDRRIVVVNNHFKSKRGDDPVFGSRQPALRATEHQRARQAGIVRAFVEELLEADPEAAVVVLGDMNEHEFRPPMELLGGGLLVDLMARVPAPERYTYNYRGNSQALDHILVSPGLAESAVIEIDVVHVNADQPEAGRSSDHDPVVARFRFRR